MPWVINVDKNPACEAVKKSGWPKMTPSVKSSRRRTVRYPCVTQVQVRSTLYCPLLANSNFATKPFLCARPANLFARVPSVTKIIVLKPAWLHRSDYEEL